jgi:hypothetical protein
MENTTALNGTLFVKLPESARPVKRPGLTISAWDEFPWKWRVYSFATKNEFGCEDEYSAKEFADNFDFIVLEPGVVPKR